MAGGSAGSSPGSMQEPGLIWQAEGDLWGGVGG